MHAVFSDARYDLQDGKIDMMKRDAQLYRETTQVRCPSNVQRHASHFMIYISI